MHRVILQEHAQTLIDGHLYFAPCSKFIDVLEFRFAHCRDAYEVGEQAFNECIRRSFGNPSVQRSVAEAPISCWTTQSERVFMWEVYGRSGPALLITVDGSQFVNYARELHPARSAAGRVKYQFVTSMVRPQVISPPREPALSDTYDLFFHKQGFYEYEQEFRIVIFERGPMLLPLPDQMVRSITLSPFAPIEASIERSLRDKFGNRVQQSRISPPYPST